MLPAPLLLPSARAPRLAEPLAVRVQDAPWTIQRLCEVLLEPHKQYKRLHKLAAAVDRLVLVTSEVRPATDLPPPPLLVELAQVNENPPKVYVSAAGPNGGRKRIREGGGGGVDAACGLLLILSNHSSMPVRELTSPLQPSDKVVYSIYIKLCVLLSID